MAANICILIDCWLDEVGGSGANVSQLAARLSQEKDTYQQSKMFKWKLVQNFANGYRMGIRGY